MSPQERNCLEGRCEPPRTWRNRGRKRRREHQGAAADEPAMVKQPPYLPHGQLPNMRIRRIVESKIEHKNESSRPGHTLQLCRCLPTSLLIENRSEHEIHETDIECRIRVGNGAVRTVVDATASEQLACDQNCALADINTTQVPVPKTP